MFTGRVVNPEAEAVSLENLRKEWEFIAKRSRDIPGSATDIWNVADYIITKIIPEMKDPSKDILNIQKKVEGHVVTREWSPLNVFPDFDPEKPLTGIHALLTYFHPYGDLVTFIGNQGSGKTLLGWRTASAVAELSGEVAHMPSVASKQAKYFESRDLSPHEREFLPKWNEKVDVFGVYDSIPAELKRTDANMSRTVERICFFENAGPLMLLIQPGQSQLRVGSISEHRMRSQGFWRRKKMKKVEEAWGISLYAEVKDGKTKGLEASYKLSEKPSAMPGDAPKSGMASPEKEYLVQEGKNLPPRIKIDDIIDTSYQNFVLLVGNMAKETQFFTRSMVEYAISKQNNKPLAFQIEKGMEYIRFMGELRGLLNEYQTKKAEAVDLYGKDLSDSDTDALQTLMDGLLDHVDVFRDKWKGTYPDISALLHDGMLHDLFGSIVQRYKTVIGGLVITGQDQKDVFKQNINMEVDQYIPLLRNLAVAPISLLVPYDIRKMKGGDYACLFPVNISRDMRVRAQQVSRETPEDTKRRKEREVEDAMGLCEFYYQLSLERQYLREKRSRKEDFMPSREGISYFNSLSDIQLNTLFREKELKMLRMAMSRYITGSDFAQVFDSNLGSFSKILREFLVATTQFTYDSGVDLKTNAKAREPSMKVIEFTKDDADDIVRYEIVRYLDDMDAAGKKDASQKGLLSRILAGYQLDVAENKASYLLSKQAVSIPAVSTPISQSVTGAAQPKGALGLFTTIPEVQAPARPGAVTRESLLAQTSPASWLKEQVVAEYRKYEKGVAEFVALILQPLNRDVSVDAAIVNYLVYASKLTTPDGGRTFDVTTSPLTVEGITGDKVVNNLFDESIQYDTSKADNPSLNEPAFHALLRRSGWEVTKDELGYQISKTESAEECMRAVKESLVGTFFPGTADEYDSFMQDLVSENAQASRDSSSMVIRTNMFTDYSRKDMTHPYTLPSKLKAKGLALDPFGTPEDPQYMVVNEKDFKVVHALRTKMPKPPGMDRVAYDGILYTAAKTYRSDPKFADYQAKDLMVKIVSDYKDYDSAVRVPGTLANLLAAKGLALFPSMKGDDGTQVPAGWTGSEDVGDARQKFIITTLQAK